MYQVVKRDGKVSEFVLSTINKAISKALVGTMAQEFHPEVMDMMMDEMADLPMLERRKEVIAKKKLRKMDYFIRLIWKMMVHEFSRQMRQLWMNRNEGSGRSNTSSVSDMMLMTMPVPPTAETANRSLWQRGIISGAAA